MRDIRPILSSTVRAAGKGRKLTIADMLAQSLLDATDQALLLPVAVSRGAVTDGLRIGVRAARNP